LFYETSSTVVAYDPTPPFSIQVGNRPAGKYIIIIYTVSPNPNTTTTYNLLLTYP